MSTSRSGSAGTYVFFVLFGAAVGWVAAVSLPQGEEAAPESGVSRIRIVGRDLGRPLPEWVQRVLGWPTPRTDAVAIATGRFPALRDAPPMVDVRYGGHAETGGEPTRATVRVEHESPDAAYEVARWLDEILRSELRNEHEIELAAGDSARRSDSSTTPSTGSPTPPLADDDVVSRDATTDELRAELDELRLEHEDQRFELRILREEEIRIWSQRTQAEGQLDAVRNALDTTPETTLVRKKLIEDAALAGAIDDEGFDTASRISALNFEEEIPNPVHVQLRAIEERIIAEGTGYQRRLDEIAMEKTTVEDQNKLTTSRMLSVQSQLREAERPLPRSRRANASPDLDATATAPSAPSPVRLPVRILGPAETRAAATNVEAHVSRVGLGMLLGAAAGWLVGFLLTSGIGRRTGAAATILLASLLLASPAEARQAKKAKVGDTAVEIEGQGVQWIGGDGDVSLESLRGKVVFLEFFQTTFKDYDRQISTIHDFLEKQADRRVAYLGVVSGEKPKDVEAFVEKMGIRYPVACDRYAKIQAKYSIGKATLFILDPDGVIRWRDNPFILHRVGAYELDRILTEYEKAVAGTFLEATGALLDDDYVKARERFTEVLARDPRPEAKAQAERWLTWIDARGAEQLKLAEAYRGAGQLADALVVLESTALQYKGTDVGKDAERQAKRLRADPALKKQLAGGKNDRAASDLLARARKALGRGKDYDGYKNLVSLIEKYPSSPAASEAKAEITKLEGDTARIAKIRDAEVRDKCSAWMNYVKAYTKSGRKAEAKSYIDKILELAPDSSYAREAKTYLKKL